MIGHISLKKTQTNQLIPTPFDKSRRLFFVAKTMFKVSHTTQRNTQYTRGLQNRSKCFSKKCQLLYVEWWQRIFIVKGWWIICITLLILFQFCKVSVSLGLYMHYGSHFLRTILNSTCIVFKGCTAFFVLQRRRITEFCVENLRSFDGTYEARRRGVNLKMQKTKQTW